MLYNEQERIVFRFKDTIDNLLRHAASTGRLKDNPDKDELRKLSLNEPEVKQSKYGHIVAQSEPTSRAAMHTKNNIDSLFCQDEIQLLEQMTKSLSNEKLISVDCQVADGSEEITARLIVPERYAHVAYGAIRLLPQINQNKAPTHQIVMFFDNSFESNKKTTDVKQKDLTIRLSHLPGGGVVKIVRNSNYFGEFKKGIFAAEDWRVKKQGKGIFLHAGCRQDYLEMSHGDYGLQNSLFVALSANGKTSTTGKIIARKGKEESWLVQDDGGTLTLEGSFKGFEAGGVFVKTEGINPGDQSEIFYGVLRPDSFLENIHVNGGGEFDFYDASATSNGRAVVGRQDIMHAYRDINIDKVHNLFIITRGPTIPAISRLSLEQATAFMILGQAEESSAGDITRAGKIKNEFFYDPFIAGDKVEHAHLFFDVLSSNNINCYLLNTGGVGFGETYHDIRLQDTIGILDSMLRGGLEDWVESEGTGLQVPKSIRAVDSILLHPKKLFPSYEFERKQSVLEKHRAETLEQYSGLNKSIRSVFIH